MSSQNEGGTQVGGSTGKTNDAPSNQSQNQSGSTNNNRYNNNERKQYNKNNGRSYNNPKGWKGSTPEIGGVLGLKTENLEHNKSFQEYCKAVKNYILRDNKEMGKFLVAPFEFDKTPKEYFMENLPDKPTPDETGVAIKEVQMDIYKEKVKRLAVIDDKLDSAVVNVFAITEGNCSDAVVEQVQSTDDYSTKKMTGDIKWLLTRLKDITSGLDTTTNKYALYYAALKEFMSMHQWFTETDEAFNLRFKDSIDTLFTHGGIHVFYSSQIHNKVLPSDEEKLKEREKFKAVSYIQKLNKSPKRYGGLLEMVEEEELFGRDGYPTDMSEVNEMLIKFRKKKTIKRETD